MITKLFEIRDNATLIVVAATKVWSFQTMASPWMTRMAWRFGWKDNPRVVLWRLSGPEDGCSADPYSWGNRTMEAAHLHINKHFEAMHNGDLIDVRVLLGEAAQPVASEFSNEPDPRNDDGDP